MNIKANSIRSLSKYLPQIGNGKPFRVGVPVLGRESKLEELGFNPPFKSDTSILPAAVGKVSRFNSQGREVKRDDLPMESSYRMVYATTRDWHGNPHSGIQHRKYKSYPREHIAGPEAEITLLKVDDALFAVSEEMSVPTTDDSRALHVFNLFLECFGECELFDENIAQIIKVKKVNWNMLPPGSYPWPKVKDHIQKAISNLPDASRQVIEYRIKQIAGCTPDHVAIGSGGFNGYFVFGFSSKGLFVLESTYSDNATYILKSDWESISQLSKSEIIAGNLHHDRLIHKANWAQALRHSLS